MSLVTAHPEDSGSLVPFAEKGWEEITTVHRYSARCYLDAVTRTLVEWASSGDLHVSSLFATNTGRLTALRTSKTLINCSLDQLYFTSFWIRCRS